MYHVIIHYGLFTLETVYVLIRVGIYVDLDEITHICGIFMLEKVYALMCIHHI